PALVGDRLPLREAAVATRPERVDFTRRSASGACYLVIALSERKRRYATPVTSPPLPVPRPGSRAAASPPGGGRTFFATAQLGQCSTRGWPRTVRATISINCAGISVSS